MTTINQTLLSSTANLENENEERPSASLDPATRAIQEAAEAKNQLRRLTDSWRHVCYLRDDEGFSVIRELWGPNGTKPITKEIREQAIINEASHGNLGRVKALLINANGKISDECRIQAIRSATENDHWNIVLFLLNKKVSEDRGESLNILFSAIRKNQPAVIDVLLGEEGLIPSSLMLDVAVDCKNRDLILKFLPMEQNTNYHYLVFEYALENNDQEILDIILRRDMSEVDLDKSMQAAVRARNRNIVQRLLTHQEVTQSSIGRSLEIAVQENHRDIVQDLCHRPTLPQHRGQAVRLAAERGDVEMIRSLLRNEQNDFLPIETYIRNELVISSARSGNADVLRAILSNIPGLPIQTRNAAMTQSAGHPAIRDILDQVRILEDPPSLFGPSFRSRITDAPQGSTEISMGVILDKVKENPLNYLQLIDKEGFPRYIVLLDNPNAIDLGGPSKEFVTTLMNALVKKGLLILDPRFRIPTAENEEQKLTLRLFGSFLSKLDERNASRFDKFLIGARFAPELFDFIKHHDPEQQNQILIKMLQPARTEADCCLVQLLTNPEDKEALAQYESYGIGTFAEWRQSITDAAICLRESFSETLKDKIMKRDAKELSLQIQGQEASAEAIIASLNINHESVREGQRKLFEQRVEWLKEWLRDADESARKSFLLVVTGRDVIPSSDFNININWGWRTDPSFELHTCFNSLDFPNITRKISKEDFKTMLTGICAGTGYNIG